MQALYLLLKEVLILSNPLDRVKDMKAFTRGEKSKVQQMGINLQKKVNSVLEDIDKERVRLHEAEIRKIPSHRQINFRGGASKSETL